MARPSPRRVRALSADHLERASDEGLVAMAEAGVVGVILPFASLYTFQPPTDGRRLVEAGVEVAVATDFNPGTAPRYDLPAALNLACLTSRLTPAEALAGATRVAAKALGHGDTIGTLEVGKRADLALWNAPDVDHWLYHLEADACVLTVKDGRVIHERQGL